MTIFSPLSDCIQHQLFIELYEQLEEAVFILDAQLKYIAVNPAYEKMVGYENDFLVGRPLSVYAAEFLSEHERMLLEDVSNNLNDKGIYKNSFTMTNHFSNTLNCQVTLKKTNIENNIFYIGTMRDISSAAKDKQQVLHLLNYNQLTGLPNRKVFLSQSNDVLLDSYQEVIIIRLNIDRYRTLINNFGQDKVDILITKFVNRLDSLELENLLCFSHFGGDDFGLLFESKDANLVRHQLDSLMQMCERPFIIDSNSVFLHISVGVSYYPKNGTQLNSLLNKAEKALHYVKQQGGDDICWYSDELNNITLDNIQLESELRQAIAANQFEPYYQPKFSLESGKIVGFEALVRWRHPTRGLLTSKSFIDAIVKYKLSFELFCQMATEVTQQLSHWRARGFDQSISINIDAAEFSHPDFLGFVTRLFERYHIAPDRLHIEVTETSLMLRHDSVQQQLIALKQLGATLALDDFGTGYASLSYLQEFPFDCLKIDKSFITDITSNPTQQTIVKAIIDMAAALNMTIIVEGIETESQRDLLLKMGCKYGQGYWFSRPVAADVATAMLA
ncbi:sensor domain-containing protein [Psychrobacter jeotgali]|uniref:sensor domain-containing protein n=1 Tax=Psychrobacter jeotgali TaxID=179010 RepID=UPI001917AD2A|nr:GGDEF domain-containing phosphodiesterase [Psychrobacter jeotgali]